jgi:hypothetical protein
MSLHIFLPLRPVVGVSLRADLPQLRPISGRWSQPKSRLTTTKTKIWQLESA